MTDAPVRFDTDVVATWGYWPDVPQLWSYSSLKELETCPLRWRLGRARYPDVWDGGGYPTIPVAPAVFGNVVHDAVETISNALGAAGANSADRAAVVGVLRSLGGISAVVETAIRQRLDGLAQNPRVDVERLTRLQDALERRVGDAVDRIKAFLGGNAIAVAAERSEQETADRRGDVRPRQPVGFGAHPERKLLAEDLRLQGQVDLLTLDASDITITDYKTGEPDQSHEDQLKTYALIWRFDAESNPGARLVTRLTVKYADHENWFSGPNEQELVELRTVALRRLAAAEAEVMSAEPNAKPAPETCEFCQVRHLCQPYWHRLAPDPAEADVGAFIDLEASVVQRLGPRSWVVEDTRHSQMSVVVRAGTANHELEVGTTVRLLTARKESSSDESSAILALGTVSEVFELISD